MSDSEAYALVGELIDSRRGRLAAVDSEVAPADIVHQNENNIGFTAGGHRLLKDSLGQTMFLVREVETRLLRRRLCAKY